MGHLNGILAQVGGNLNNNFQKSQMPGGLPGGGMLKLRFDRYITSEGQGNVCLVLSPSGAAGSVFSCVLRELTGGVFCYVGGPAEWVFSDVLVPKMSVSWDKDPTAGNIASTLSPN